MTLEDLVEAHLAGEMPEAPAHLRADFERAIAARNAIEYALGETIHVSPTSTDDRAPPKLPDDYEVVREIGRGGMGVVYLVKQKSLGRQVAVKVLRPGETTYGPIVQRFMEEARHLARLRHPNIVSVHETGSAGDEPYFTMDFVEGESLAAILARERLSPTRAVAILKQAAEGVRHAHEQGIIHRDLKPGNILVDAGGHASVSDFGLARDVTRDSNLTRSGEIMGTPAYMAPEQAQGLSELIGETTDVHALGLLLYEMLTGQAPHGCDAPANVLVRLLKEEPAAPRQVDRRIPRDLETICLKAMAKAPERRYQNVQALLEDVRRYESGEPVLAKRPGPAQRAVRFLGRQRKVVVTVVVTATLLLAIGPWWFDKSAEVLRSWGDERHAAGEHQGALQAYERALLIATGAQRQQVLRNIVRCARETGDVKSAIRSARELIDEDPDVSFGELDYLVAQAVVTELRTKNASRSVRHTPDENRPLLDLARRRLTLFLGRSEGDAKEREEATDLLDFIRKELAREPQVGAPSKAPQSTIPKGTPAELLARAEDSDLNPWQRGEAAYAAGLALEKSGDQKGAQAAFSNAFDLMRSVYPTYTGVTGALMKDPKDEAPDTRECESLRAVFGALRRVNPRTPDQLTGGIRFRVEGVKIPIKLRTSVDVTLWEPVTEDSKDGSDHPPRFLQQRMVVLGVDQTAWVGVADGRYRLKVSAGMRSYSGAEASRVSPLLELGFKSLPTEVEIAGDTQEIVIPAWIMQEIRLLSPAEGASVDLQNDAFRWSEVADAAHYRVRFSKFDTDKQSGAPRQSGAGWARTKAPLLRLNVAQDRSIEIVKRSLIPGRTGAWTVSAFDSNDRQIGASMESARPFFVAVGLGEE